MGVVHDMKAFLSNINLNIFDSTQIRPDKTSRPEAIKLYSYSTQLSTKFQLLIKTKIQKSEGVSCFKCLRCGIYHAYKC